MDENVYTYPEVVRGAGFSDAEKKRWDRNLRKLINRVEGKFGRKKRKRKKTNGS